MSRPPECFVRQRLFRLSLGGLLFGFSRLPFHRMNFTISLSLFSFKPFPKKNRFTRAAVFCLCLFQKTFFFSFFTAVSLQ